MQRRKALPRQVVLAETGVVGGDSVRGRGSLVAGRERNGSAPRTHRRAVDGTCGKHSSERRDGLAGRLGAPAQRRRGVEAAGP